jgi:hypothetical protein
MKSGIKQEFSACYAAGRKTYARTVARVRAIAWKLPKDQNHA